MAVKNFGRLNNFISGITGVTPGGSASLNMNTDSRVHRLNFQTSGIGYGIGGTTPTAVPTVTDAGVTFTPVVVNGVLHPSAGQARPPLLPVTMISLLPVATIRSSTVLLLRSAPAQRPRTLSIRQPRQTFRL